MSERNGRSPRSWRRVTVAAAVVASILFITACGGGDTDDGGTSTPRADELSVALELSVAGTTIPAVVTVTNGSDGALTIARPVISPNFVYFEVRDGSGAVLPFDGPWLSLRPREEEDFVELAPGASVEHEFDLARWYRLPAGAYTVTAEYLSSGHNEESEFGALVVAGIVSSPVDLEVS